MVSIAPPPPSNKPKPQFHCIKQGEELFRIYRPEYNPTPTNFRSWGPNSRFDHHLGNTCSSYSYAELECGECENQGRSICYTGLSLSCCLVEVFGDIGRVEITDHKIAILIPKRDLMLLDVRASGAKRAGANSATFSTERRPLSQAWSRYFYEQEETYSTIHGIIYPSAHNQEDAIAIYDRAAGLITCPANHVFPLRHELFRGPILKAASQNNLEIIPYW